MSKLYFVITIFVLLVFSHLTRIIRKILYMRNQNMFNKIEEVKQPWVKPVLLIRIPKNTHIDGKLLDTTEIPIDPLSQYAPS